MEHRKALFIFIEYKSFMATGLMYGVESRVSLETRSRYTYTVERRGTMQYTRSVLGIRNRTISIRDRDPLASTEIGIPNSA